MFKGEEPAGPGPGLSLAGGQGQARAGPESVLV
jgi:hypothetical protein